MSLILFRVLFFCLVPVGIFILVKTIRMLKGIFAGEVIAEIPFTQQEVLFEITRPGVYAIWQKGQLFRKTPVDKFQLKLNKIASGEAISLPQSFFRPYINGFDTGRMEMNRFSAESGQYRLTVVEGTSVSVFEKLAFNLFPAKPVDYSQYFIQVRESRPIYYMIAAIPLFTLAGFCMIGGMVAGFIAPDILAGLGIQTAGNLQYLLRMNCC
ncbi:hypothetical protein [Mucilaginibacter paludis]|uniref:Uncharacterized protein n=1 Tax=Mucilaginibacter paludis DSM 18603 TaxID=714943 RepID=H1YBG6_9SPHI|nr:hypothetical protein [Mucilaginibacter paludis]EHQ25037.1 hypothetical protein Mucpa_0856 [Mucilaginibacter paludis DSM 18603]